MTLVDIILPPVGLSDMRKSLNSFLHEPVDRHCTAFSTDCPDGFLFDKTSKSISSALGRYLQRILISGLCTVSNRFCTTLLDLGRLVGEETYGITFSYFVTLIFFWTFFGTSRYLRGSTDLLRPFLHKLTADASPIVILNPFTFQFIPVETQRRMQLVQLIQAFMPIMPSHTPHPHLTIPHSPSGTHKAPVRLP